MTLPIPLQVDLQLAADLNTGRCADPFAVLGVHREADGHVARAFLPRTREVRLGEGGPLMTRIEGSDLFVWRGARAPAPNEPLLRSDDAGHTQALIDPYRFGCAIGEFDRQVFGEGHHWHAYRFLGAHPHSMDDIRGVRFATWAPGARRVSVIADFNHWDGRCHPMRRHPGGIWELFIPQIEAGARYKYEIVGADGALRAKADPYAQAAELRPQTASVVAPESTHAWQDAGWLTARAQRGFLHAPMSIYEVHAGSWQRGDDGHWLSYRELGARLIPYVQQMGFTHVELLPVMEHPFDGSWGYQTLGYFAPTSRFGSPDDFRAFVDACHQAGIGVLLDWTPAHFPTDAHGPAWYDGSALYEHPDPRRGKHPDWGTLIFDYGRPEVRNFLLASALYWLEEFHCDGLRVDAVASMLYLDYSRKPGEWLPNAHGGRENLDAIEFFKQLNAVVHERHAGAVVIAEESTAWPMVTRPTYLGGLGFSMKWNMGWMHDTLDYMARDPVHRRHHHDALTFGLLYAHSENFVLPLSHDEVVHGKGSLLHKMPGDDWQRFAQLRTLYAYQWTYPGKKLLFMGQEFAQRSEWNHARALDWGVLAHASHRGVQQLLADLNRLYRDTPALHVLDFDSAGFEWVDCHDRDQSVISYLRRNGEDCVLVVINFTPVMRSGYRVGVPHAGTWRECINTDAACYGGGNVGNFGTIHAEPLAWNGRSASLALHLPPLAAIILRPE